MIKKGLAVAVILLFIGVAFAPSINSSVVEDKLVEFDVELCGLGRKHTVSLTQQEADEVEMLFDDIEQRLSEVETRDEAEVIFKESIMELDEYGLLGGLSVKQAYRLVTGNHQNPRVLKIIERMFNEEGISNNNNYFCLVVGYGESYGLTFQRPIAIFLPLFLQLIGTDVYYLYYFIRGLFGLYGIINKFNPVSLFSVIGCGYIDPSNHNKIPAKGNITTIGALGLKKWETPIYGQFPLQYAIQAYKRYFLGIVGFSGIKICNIAGCNFLGGALAVNLGSEPPDI